MSNAVAKTLPQFRNRTTPSADTQKIDDFLDLSQHLLAIVNLENSVFLDHGDLTLEAYVQKKMALMASFEEQARNLLETLQRDSNTKDEQVMLVHEIRKIRSALQVNSTYQMNMLKKRLTAKNAGFAADPAWQSSDTPPESEKALCH
jgi:hypothetical protein